METQREMLETLELIWIKVTSIWDRYIERKQEMERDKQKTLIRDHERERLREHIAISRQSLNRATQDLDYASPDYVESAVIQLQSAVERHDSLIREYKDTFSSTSS